LADILSVTRKTKLWHLWAGPKFQVSTSQLPTLHCTCYRIHASTIRRPWLTFVNTLANSILGRFYTARTQRIASWVWPWAQFGGVRGDVYPPLFQTGGHNMPCPPTFFSFAFGEVSK